MGKLQAATDTLKELAFAYAVLLLLSTLLFMTFEGQAFSDSLYWAGTTATSTGYGDISPKTAPGKMIAFVLMHLSIFVIAPMIIVRLVDRLNEDRHAFTHEEQEHILQSLARIESALEQRGIGAESAGNRSA